MFSFRPNIISSLPKLPESTRRKQAKFNKGSLFYIHCVKRFMRAQLIFTWPPEKIKGYWVAFFTMFSFRMNRAIMKMETLVSDLKPF
jgi:hypothetical protein